MTTRTGAPVVVGVDGSDSATNAVVLYENTRVDSGSALTLRDNRATQVAAIGGTALVNALAGYRDASLSGSPTRQTNGPAGSSFTPRSVPGAAAPIGNVARTLAPAGARPE